jgi:hypothetical protein
VSEGGEGRGPPSRPGPRKVVPHPAWELRRVEESRDLLADALFGLLDSLVLAFLEPSPSDNPDRMLSLSRAIRRAEESLEKAGFMIERKR